MHPSHFPAMDVFEAAPCWATQASSQARWKQAIGYKTFSFCPFKGKSSESADLILSQQPLLMTLIWNDDYVKTKVRKTPLLPTSHITHFSEQQLPKHSALVCTCSLQLPETNQCPTAGHRRHLPSLYERPESWAGGQIPSNCPPSFSSGARLGLDWGKTQGKALVCPSLQNSCTAFTAQPTPRLQHSAWALPHQRPQRPSAAQATPLFGKDEETQPCQCLFWPDWEFPELTES